MNLEKETKFKTEIANILLEHKEIEAVQLLTNTIYAKSMEFSQERNDELVKDNERLNENQMYIVDKILDKIDKLSHGDWSEEARLLLNKIDSHIERILTRQDDSQK